MSDEARQRRDRGAGGRARRSRIGGAILGAGLIGAVILAVGLAGGPSGTDDASVTGSPTAGSASAGSGSFRASAAPSSPVTPTPLTAPSSPAGPTPSATSATAPPATAPPATATSGRLTLGAALALLEIQPEDRAGYRRSLFPIWIDADGDGCNTRREVLIEEAIVAPTVGTPCRLFGGAWSSLYDGVQTTDSSTFDIDHVVPLAEAWDSGASGWPTERRTRFANDLDVPWALVAVSAASNRSKGDRDPADWLPPLAGVRCEYLTMWLDVKLRWDLAIDPRERSAIAAFDPTCPAAVVRVPAP